MEVAAFHPQYFRIGTRLCGPIRHVTVPGRYPASRSAEPGLSSTRKHAAAAWPTPSDILPWQVFAERAEIALIIVELASIVARKPPRTAEDRQRRHLARRRFGGKRGQPRRGANIGIVAFAGKDHLACDAWPRL